MRSRPIRVRDGGERPADAGARAVGVAEPDPTAVVLDDLLAQGQADARSAVRVPAVETLEDDEHLVGELGLDADPVVPALELPRVSHPPGGDPDLRGPVGVAELDRVAHQVLPEHRQQGGVAVDHG